MRISFDPNKNTTNTAKHGVSLAEAAQLVWDEALIWEDARRNYNEIRQCALAPIGSRLYCIVYVDRSGVRRIISLRKANNREVQRYVEAMD
jgi:uncharacterized protein